MNKFRLLRNLSVKPDPIDHLLKIGICGVFETAKEFRKHLNYEMISNTSVDKIHVGLLGYFDSGIILVHFSYMVDVIPGQMSYSVSF